MDYFFFSSRSDCSRKFAPTSQPIKKLKPTAPVALSSWLLWQLPPLSFVFVITLDLVAQTLNRTPYEMFVLLLSRLKKSLFYNVYRSLLTFLSSRIWCNIKEYPIVHIFLSCHRVFGQLIIIFTLVFCQLFLFNFYPFVQRYLQPHQRGNLQKLCYCRRLIFKNFIFEFK